MPISDEPNSRVCAAADAALRAMEASLEIEGAEIERAFVLLVAKGLPPDELDACTAGTGIEDAADLLGLLMSHVVQAGQQLGLKIAVVPVMTGES